MSGRRELKTDEKSFVAEIARSFHVERAVNKATKIEKRNNTNTSTSTSNAAASSGELKKKTKRARRKTGGGSVWITLKGGFASVPIVSSVGGGANAAESSETSGMEKAAKLRGERTEQCLVKAVAVAEEYMKSARDQAAAAGLHYTGETAEHAKLASSVSSSSDPVIDYTEGDAYLKEQHTIASLGVKKALKAPCGAHLRSLLGNSSSSDAAVMPPSFASREAREAFEDAVVAAKKFIGSEEDDTALEVDALRAPFYFSLQQQQDSQLSSGKGTNNGNTLCIVRSKVSGITSSSTTNKEVKEQVDADKKKQKARKSKEERGKKNTIIFRTKSKAEAFVQSLMNNVIRKEMSGAMRIRDGTGAVEPTAAATASSSATPQNQSKGTSAKGKKGRR